MPAVSTPRFYPERLEEAVKARALTWKALADSAAIKQSTLSDYKNGNAIPSPDQLAKISEALDFPEEYFLKSPNPRSRLIGPRLFRGPAGNTQKASNEAEARLVWLAECIEFANRWLNLPEPDFLDSYRDIGDPLFLGLSDVEAISLSVRKKLGFGLDPIRNLLRTLEKSGIPVIKYMGLSNNTIKIDALSQHTATGRPLCVLFPMEEPSLARENFSLAHELGHIVLHHSINENRYSSPSDAKLIEDQANRFASSFLLPSQSFLDEVYLPSLRTFEYLKRKWQTSIATMIVRCYELGRIDRSKYSSLYVMLSQRRWRKVEPLDNALEPESPKLLKKIIETLLEKKQFSGDDLSTLLALNPRDLASISGMSTSYFLPKSASENVLEFNSKDS